MKLLLVSVLLVVALHSGAGAPKKARYNYVKCNPDDDKGNCVTFQSAEMNWTPDLPTKLPASAVEYLEGTSMEEERQKLRKMDLLVADGSGLYEGSGSEATSMEEERQQLRKKDLLVADGSGLDEGSGGASGERFFFERQPETSDKSKEEHIVVPREKELDEDNLLQM